MSVDVMAAVWKCGPAEQTPAFVLLAIADNADDFGFACPSHDTIALKARCDKRTVMRAIDQLVRDGWLGVLRKVINAKGNAYFVNLQKIGVIPSPRASMSHLHMMVRKGHGDKLSRIFLPEKSGDTSGFSGDNPQPSQVTKAQSQVTPVQGQVTSTPEIGDTACHTNHKEPPKEPSGTEPSGEPPRESESTPTPPLREGVQSPKVDHREEDAKRFQLFKTALKLELGSQPQHPNFRPVVQGAEDWDACFRDWWLDDVRYEHDGPTPIMRLLTAAREPMLVVLGQEKYRTRLDRLLRRFFSPKGRYTVMFNVQPAPQENINPAA